MLTKKFRLTKNGSFNYVYRKGETGSSAKIRMVFVRGGIVPKIGFSVSNKLGKANVRNLLKRRMRAAARNLLPETKNAQIVFVAKEGASSLSYCEVFDCMERLMDKCNLLKKTADKT